MIKRSFFALSQPRLTYDLLEPDPKTPEAVSTPDHLTLLLNESLDTAQDALLKKGNAVKKGERLALYNNSKAYVISPAAGTIQSLEPYADDFGKLATKITIHCQAGKSAESLELEFSEDLAFAADYLGQLPGALPFETFTDDAVKISTIILTCSDTDICTTTSQYVGATCPEELKKGALILKRLTNVSRILMTAPEDLNLRGGFDSIQVLKTAGTYPDALPAMILKDHFDTELEPGQTPEDKGFSFIPAEAVVSLAKAYEDKALPFEKIFTFIDKTGAGRRVKATIGTALTEVFNAFGIQVNHQDRIIIGGPMRGFATHMTDHPVTPDMDTVIVQDKSILPELSDNACVNCGKCIRICPANVPVNLLVRFLEADQYEEAADKYDLESCIECGLCAYVCMARIPLFQYIRLGKHELLKLRAEA